MQIRYSMTVAASIAANASAEKHPFLGSIEFKFTFLSCYVYVTEISIFYHRSDKQGQTRLRSATV
jgi:hypothetical protein